MAPPHRASSSIALRRAASRLLVYVSLVLVALVSVFPFLWAVTSSLRPHQEIFTSANPFGMRTFVPPMRSITLRAYAYIFLEDHFGRYMFNSALVASTTVLLGLFVNSMAGFAFARFRFPGREILFGLVLLTFMVPFEIIVLPLYLVVRWLHWLDTYQALVVPAVADGFSIFLVRQFAREIPGELIDAARVDGAGWWRIYWELALPLMRPALVTAGLLQFVRQWDAFFWPLVAVSSRELSVTQVALTRYITEYVTFWDRLLAAVVASSLPVILLFFLLQRHYVRGIATSGFK